MDLEGQDGPEDEESASLRYAAYAARFKQLILSTKRYIAYSSDFGEAFR